MKNTHCSNSSNSISHAGRICALVLMAFVMTFGVGVQASETAAEMPTYGSVNADAPTHTSTLTTNDGSSITVEYRPLIYTENALKRVTDEGYAAGHLSKIARLTVKGGGIYTNDYTISDGVYFLSLSSKDGNWFVDVVDTDGKSQLGGPQQIDAPQVGPSPIPTDRLCMILQPAKEADKGFLRVIYGPQALSFQFRLGVKS